MALGHGPSRRVSLVNFRAETIPHMPCRISPPPDAVDEDRLLFQERHRNCRPGK